MGVRGRRMGIGEVEEGGGRVGINGGGGSMEVNGKRGGEEGGLGKGKWGGVCGVGLVGRGVQGPVGETLGSEGGGEKSRARRGVRLCEAKRLCESNERSSIRWGKAGGSMEKGNVDTGPGVPWLCSKSAPGRSHEIRPGWVGGLWYRYQEHLIIKEVRTVLHKSSCTIQELV